MKEEARLRTLVREAYAEGLALGLSLQSYPHEEVPLYVQETVNLYWPGSVVGAKL